MELIINLIQIKSITLNINLYIYTHIISLIVNTTCILCINKFPYKNSTLERYQKKKKNVNKSNKYTQFKQILRV